MIFTFSFPVTSTFELLTSSLLYQFTPITTMYEAKSEAWDAVDGWTDR